MKNIESFHGRKQIAFKHRPKIVDLRNRQSSSSRVLLYDDGWRTRKVDRADEELKNKEAVDDNRNRRPRTLLLMLGYALQKPTTLCH